MQCLLCADILQNVVNGSVFYLCIRKSVYSLYIHMVGLWPLTDFHPRLEDITLILSLERERRDFTLNSEK